jgi:hypothetical protein
VRLDLQFTNEADRYQAETSAGWLDIESIEVVAEVWEEIREEPIERIFEYVGEDGALSQSVEFSPFVVGAREHTVALHVLPGKKLAVVEVRSEEVTDNRARPESPGDLKL